MHVKKVIAIVEDEKDLNELVKMCIRDRPYVMQCLKEYKDQGLYPFDFWK